MTATLLSEWARVTHARERRAHTRSALYTDPDAATRDALLDALTTDALTGAATRDAGLVRCRPGDWVTMVDLDGFKPVNDTFGHAAGDQVLAVAAARLGELGRVVRLGGDEFVVIADAPIPADVVRAVVSAPVLTLSGVVTVGASSGSAQVTGTDVDAALAAADAVMYSAKRAR